MKQVILQLILQFLKDNGLIQSLIKLQSQSKTFLKQYPKQIEFFKKILLKGDFSEAVQFIWTFQHKLDREILSGLTLKILKQKLYELLEDPEELELKNLFEKEIVDHCSEEEYQQLFTYLTCRSVKQIPDMNDWTPAKGRFACFQQICPYLQKFFNSSRSPKPKSIPFKLQQAIKNMLSSDNDSSNSLKPKKFDEKEQEKVILKDNLPKSSQYYGSNIQQPTKFQQKINIINKQTTLYPNQVSISESRMEKSEAFIQKPMMQQSSLSRKMPNNYVNPSAIKNSEIQFKKSNIYDEKVNNPSSASNNKKIDVLKSNKSFTPSSYLKEFQIQKELNQSEMLQEEVKKNIAYLDQNNDSQVFKDQEHENFTFSHGADQQMYQCRPKKIYKLATISDPKAIRVCQFSPSGQHFALGTNSSYLKIFDIEQLFEKGQPKDLIPDYQIPQLHSKSIFSLDWSVNQKCIVTCSNDLTIKITDFISDTYRFSSHRTNVIGRHQSCIRMVKFNSAETRVVSCGDDCFIKVWDIGKIKKCMTLKGHEQGVSAFKFADNQGDSILYSVGKDSVIRKWDVRMGQCVNISKRQDSQMTFIANNTDRIVVSHKNGYVSFFDQNLQLEYSYKIHEQQIRSIDGNSYDDSLLTASFDGHISIFNEKTAQSPNYHQHNEIQDDKVVFATFMNHPEMNGFASTSTLGICNVFSYE